MKTIIVYGKEVYMQVDRMFTCKHCGCVFVASYDEYEHKSGYGQGIIFGTRCPCCDRMAYTNVHSIYVSAEEKK